MIFKKRIFECLECGYVWEEDPCGDGAVCGHEIRCPECNSIRKRRVQGAYKTECASGRDCQSCGG